MRKNILRKRKDIIIKEFINYVYDFYGKNGIYDIQAYKPIARMGYKDYTTVDKKIVLERPK